MSSRRTSSWGALAIICAVLSSSVHSTNAATYSSGESETHSKQIYHSYLFYLSFHSLAPSTFFSFFYLPLHILFLVNLLVHLDPHDSSLSPLFWLPRSMHELIASFLYPDVMNPVPATSKYAISATGQFQNHESPSLRFSTAFDPQALAAPASYEPDADSCALRCEAIPECLGFIIYVEQSTGSLERFPCRPLNDLGELIATTTASLSFARILDAAGTSTAATTLSTVAATSLSPTSSLAPPPAQAAVPDDFLPMPADGTYVLSFQGAIEGSEEPRRFSTAFSNFALAAAASYVSSTSACGQRCVQVPANACVGFFLYRHSSGKLQCRPLASLGSVFGSQTTTVSISYARIDFEETSTTLAPTTTSTATSTLSTTASTTTTSTVTTTSTTTLSTTTPSSSSALAPTSPQFASLGPLGPFEPLPAETEYRVSHMGALEGSTGERFFPAFDITALVASEVFVTSARQCADLCTSVDDDACVAFFVYIDTASRLRCRRLGDVPALGTTAQTNTQSLSYARVNTPPFASLVPTSASMTTMTPTTTSGVTTEPVSFAAI